LRRLSKHFPDELVVIGVHSAKFPSEHLTFNILEAVKRHEIDHPVVNDSGFAVWQQYGVHAWPTIVLIDPHGKIATQQAGEIDADDFILLIDALIEDFAAEGALDRTPLDLGVEPPLEPLRALNYPRRFWLPAMDACT